MSEIDKIKKYCKKLEEKVIKHDKALKTKVEIEDLDEVRDLIVQLPKTEEVKYLRNYVTESITKFKEDNDTFFKDFDTHNAIIRRYDEVITQKASKIDLTK